MTVQCLYQNDPKDAAAVLGQRNACRRAANKLGWLIQQERICDASEGTPLLLIEQNARAALEVADYGYVLETGAIALEGPARELAVDPRVIETYLGAKK